MILLLLFIGYAILAGAIEAYLYHFQFTRPAQNIFNSKENKDLHPMYMVQRLVVGIGFVHGEGFFTGLMLLIGLAFTFPLMHDGAYYEIRHWLNPNTYPKGWKSESTTSTAKMEFDLKTRIIMFAIGVILVCFFSA